MSDSDLRLSISMLREEVRNLRLTIEELTKTVKVSNELQKMDEENKSK